MAQSAWWSAQKILRAGLRAPFRSARLSILVVVVFALPIVVVVVGLRALELGLINRNLGRTFFDPDGRTDPVLVQHALWLAGSPEIQVLLAVLLLPFFAWAQAVWFQGQSGAVSLKVGLGHWGRILSIYGTVLIALVIILALSLVIPALAFLALPVALFILFRFAPVLVATQAGDSPPWRFSHVAPTILVWCVVDFIVLLFLLAIPAGALEAGARAALMQPGNGSLVITLQFLAVVVRCLAWVFAAFVLSAMVVEIARKGAAAQAGLFR